MNSSLEVMLEGLEMIWAPGAEAVKVQQALGVRSLADMTAALERAGYEVCCVDLPERVSGFAKVIEGKPHIVLNRAKSAEHLQYTIPQNSHPLTLRNFKRINLRLCGFCSSQMKKNARTC
jgi:hypothetical protein